LFIYLRLQAVVNRFPNVNGHTAAIRYYCNVAINVWKLYVATHEQATQKQYKHTHIHIC